MKSINSQVTGRCVFCAFAVLFCLFISFAAFADASRFTTTEPVSGQEVVADAVTGLMWQKNYVTGRTWQQALAYCESLSYGGHSDWRLPNVQELSSLVNMSRVSPASDFPGMPSNGFWSSSSNVGNPNVAWYVNFYGGYVSNAIKTYNYSVRCVRLGP